jgi:hypothetical protein
VLLCESELKQRRHAAAITAYQSAVEAPTLASAMRFRALAGTGLAHEEQRQYGPAAKLYEEVATKSPDKTLAAWAKERLAAVNTAARSEAPAPEKATPKKAAPEKTAPRKALGGTK